MATSTSQSTKKANNNAAADARRQAIKGIIKKHLDAYFSSTLGKQDDIVNIFTALIFHESRFNLNLPGILIPLIPGKKRMANDYEESPVIQNIRNDPNTTEIHKKRLLAGRRAMGLTQSMGWNHIKGASKKTGKCYMEILCKDDKMRADLIIAPEALASTTLEDFLLGEKNMDKMILAGLLVLEDKWKNCKPHKDGWKVGTYVFPLHISAAVAAYLGKGFSDDLGTTPLQYAATIVGGDMYKQANGASAPVIRDSAIQYASTDGPTLALSSTTRVSTSGCKESQSQPDRTKA